MKDGVTISTHGENAAEISSTESEVNEDDKSTNNENITKTTDNNAIMSNLTMDRSVLLESYDNFCESDLAIPRDTDRIMEQFILMLLRIGAHLNKQGSNLAQIYSAHAPGLLPSLLLGEHTETPPSVGNDKTRTTSYLQQYPQIFMKRDSTKLWTTPPNSPDDSNKNLKRSENGSKLLNGSDKFVDLKQTFEIKEMPHQEVSEILLDNADSRNYRKSGSLNTDHDIRSINSKEKVHDATNISEVGSYVRNKDTEKQQGNQYTKETISNDTFDDVIESLIQGVTENREEHNELDRQSVSKLSNQSSKSTLRENGS